MKLFLATFLIVAVSASLLEEHNVKFQAFKLKHSKIYKNQVEESARFIIFRNNLRSIEEHNALYEQGHVSYKKGINQFSDMTSEEFKAMLTLHQKSTLYATTKYVKTGAAVASSVDWRSQGQVTKVKNQGSCGSCWAFSITGSTEGAYYRKTGKLMSFSEQQLVDCTWVINWGCSGGSLEDTFLYIIRNGLETEDTYPYKGIRYTSSLIEYWEDTQPNDEKRDTKTGPENPPIPLYLMRTKFPCPKKVLVIGHIPRVPQTAHYACTCNDIIKYTGSENSQDPFWCHVFPHKVAHLQYSINSIRYKGKDGECQYNSSKVVTKVDDYVTMYKDESALLEAVATVGPVSVAMDASELSSYSSGIFSDSVCTKEKLNHGVLIVGYGTNNGQDYWLVKNSWGSSWGEDGYFKIVRGTNQCGIAEDTVYPIIK